jgi:hypothetical protein
MNPNQKSFDAQRDETEKLPGTPSTKSTEQIHEIFVNPEDMQMCKLFNQTTICIPCLWTLVAAIDFECQSFSMESVSVKFRHFVL